jgi:hypothetical protein
MPALHDALNLTNGRPRSSPSGVFFAHFAAAPDDMVNKAGFQGRLLIEACQNPGKGRIDAVKKRVR